MEDVRKQGDKILDSLNAGSFLTTWIAMKVKSENYECIRNEVFSSFPLRYKYGHEHSVLKHHKSVFFL